MLPSFIRQYFVLLHHQPNEQGKIEGVKVFPKDSFASLNLRNGSMFLLVHKSIIGSNNFLYFLFFFERRRRRGWFKYYKKSKSVFSN
jgi:hypothetical protein